MKITKELLQKHKASKEGMTLIERIYPDGAEIIELISNPQIPKEMLHWGRKQFSHSEEELAAYCAVCNIVNSEGYWYSTDVKDSTYVVKSKNVDKSQSIFESSDVSLSSDIVNSDGINDSKQVFYSSMVDDCTKVFKGQNIVKSSNVCNSTMIARSKNIIGSSDVFDSSEIVRCNNVTNSHFCQDCNNIKSCLFCEGIENAEYYIFNKQVDKNRYEMITRQYQKYMTDTLSFIRDWPENLAVGAYSAPTRKFDDWYSQVDSKFWKWARTLPGFDMMLLYNITMLPEILLEETK